MSRLTYYVESNLVWFVIIVAGLGLVLPEAGKYLQPLIGLLLAALMFIISLTFDAHAVRLVLLKTSRQFLALILVNGPMWLAGLLTGRLFFWQWSVGYGSNFAWHLTHRCIISGVSVDGARQCCPGSRF